MGHRNLQDSGYYYSRHLVPSISTWINGEVKSLGLVNAPLEQPLVIKHSHPGCFHNSSLEQYQRGIGLYLRMPVENGSNQAIYRFRSS